MIGLFELLKKTNIKNLILIKNVILIKKYSHLNNQLFFFESIFLFV